MSIKKITIEYEESKKAQLLVDFIPILFNHLDYSNKQYGDADVDEISKWNSDQLMKNVEKYIARFGKNARAGQEKLDIIKMIDCLIRLYYKDIKVTKTKETILLEKIKESCYNVLTDELKQEIDSCV